MSPIRRSSVTMRVTVRRRLAAASQQMSARGIRFSEQRLLRECVRFALRFWRGRKAIAGRNKKYNKRRGPFEILPLYTTEALRSAAWARCHHSGISFSRFVDFAVSTYLARVVEYWLRFGFAGRDQGDVVFWEKRHSARRNSADFVISYAAQTMENDGQTLIFMEKTQILAWPPPREPVKLAF